MLFTARTHTHTFHHPPHPPPSLPHSAPSHTHIHTHTPLPVHCPKLCALPICVSGYRCGNSIRVLSCKIHCVGPPPSVPPPLPALSIPPSLHLSSAPLPSAWGGVKLSLSLCDQKCPFFRRRGAIERVKKRSERERRRIE